MKTPSQGLLFQVCCATFCVIVVLSNIISAKMWSVPFFQDFAIPAGLLTYPLTFLISDLVTEIYGAKRAKAMVYIAFAMSILSYVILRVILSLPSNSQAEAEAFNLILGLQGWVITASLTAYIAAQLIDIWLYAKIKYWTEGKHLWLRNNGSTWTSQMVDTLLVNTIYLHFGLEMGFSQIVPIMLFSYLYKSFFSVINTPFFYLFVYLFKNKWVSLSKTNESL